MKSKAADRTLFSVFPEGTGKLLPQMIDELWREQIRNWIEFARNHRGLKHVRVRTVRCGGYSVKLQWNPKRMASTAAPDSNGRPGRPCFLCAHRLPDLQKGVLYRGQYRILCNPVPIFDRHYTVPHVRHVPQDLKSSLSDMLWLSKDLGEAFVVFYNGSQCGASAPDHLHFQICPARGFPMPERHFPMSLVRSSGSCRLSAFRKLGRGLSVFSGQDMEGISHSFLQYLELLGSFLGSEREPKVNVICSFRKKTWHLAIYARKKHRPDAYYLSEGERLLVSPGAVDMSGLVILPRQDDFERVTAVDMRKVYREVTVEDRIVESIIKKLSD